MAIAFSSLQAFLCAEPKKANEFFCAFYDKDDLIPDLSPSISGNFLILISREYFVLILTKNNWKSYLVFVLKVLNLILISHYIYIYWSDITFLLYNELNKGNKNDLSIDQKSLFSGSIDFNAFPKQKVDYRLNDYVIEENESKSSFV